MTRSMLPGLLLASLFALIAPCDDVAAAETAFLVDVDVSCDDVELRSLVRGFFSRELRELGDVRVAETGVADYRVAVIAQAQGRRWVMSVVIGAQLDTRDLALASRAVVAPTSGADLDDQLAASVDGYLKTVTHWLGTGSSPDRLNEEISNLVKSFDKHVLEERRAD